MQVWKVNLGTNSYIQSCPNILDVNRDGTPDAVVAQYAGDCRVYALNGLNGQVLWHFQAGTTYTTAARSLQTLASLTLPSVSFL